jgi:tetratricopeptide (TPR) repeat protein
MTNYALGVYVAMVEKDPVGAIPFFEKAVGLFPPLAEAHYNLGNCYMKAGRIAQATASLRQAIRYSDGEDGIADLAREHLGWLDTTVRNSSSFQTVDEFIENQRLFDAAFESLRRREYEESAGLFQRVLEKRPDHVPSYGNLGLAEAGLGHKAAALAYLDKALALDPSYQPAIYNRKGIETMIEGEPHNIGEIAETEYYREAFEAKNPPKVGWWRKLNFWLEE